MKNRRYFLGLVLVMFVLFAVQISAFAVEKPQVFDKDKDGFVYVKEIKVIEKTVQEEAYEGGKITLEKAIGMWLLPLGPRPYVLAVK